MSSSLGTPTHSPPLTPMLGCTLADKMTTTMPMMNHSFRIVAKTPMLKRRGEVDWITPPAPVKQPARSFTTLLPLPRTILYSQQEQVRRSYFRTHGPRITVKMTKNAQQKSTGRKSNAQCKNAVEEVRVLGNKLVSRCYPFIRLPTADLCDAHNETLRQRLIHH